MGLRSRPTGRGGGALPELSSDDDGDDDTSATASPGNKGDDNDDDGGDDAESMTSTPTPKKRRRGSKGRCGKKRAKKDFEEELPTEETIIPKSDTFIAITSRTQYFYTTPLKPIPPLVLNTLPI